MKLVPIGYSSFINAERIIALLPPDSAPVKRIIQDSREKGTLIDATFGRSTKTVIVSDSANIILSALSPEAIESKAEES